MGKYAQANLIHATAHRPVDREFEILDRTKFGRGDKAKVDALGKGNFAWSNTENAWIRMKGIEEAAIDKQIAIDDNRRINDALLEGSRNTQAQALEQLRGKNAQALEKLRGENALALENERGVNKLAEQSGEQAGLMRAYSERQKAEVDRLNELLDNARASNKFTADELANMEKQVMLKQLGIVSSPRLTLGEQPFVPQSYQDPNTGRTFLQLQKGGEWVEDVPAAPPAPSVTDRDKVKFVQEMIKGDTSIADAIKMWDTMFPSQNQSTKKPTSALDAAKGNAGQPNNAKGGKKASLSDFERKE